MQQTQILQQMHKFIEYKWYGRELETRAFYPFSSGLAMHTVKSTVCDNFESGTDDEVFMIFRSTKLKPGEKKETRTCITESLDTGIIGHWTNDWSMDSVQTWGHQHWDDQDHNFLGSCAKDFRLYDNLEVKVIIPEGRQIPLGAFSACAELPIDDVEICSLVVIFGSGVFIISKNPILLTGRCKIKQIKTFFFGQ